MVENTVLSIIACFLVGFVGYFALRFVAPWLAMRRRLDAADAALQTRYQLALGRDEAVTDLDGIARDLSDDSGLSHLWDEFRHTLHRERSEDAFDESGQAKLRYRQTVPAEVYFSTRSLIDVPLRTDFFRHLPGILTGLGIIGTFFGLITGLGDFNISGDPAQVNRNVESLIDAVRSAFVISAIAIVLAIIITAIEKSMVASLHGRVQRLQQTIDGMFDAGAGEDYLAEIARGSEQTATHLGHLKEGMINDLRPLFEELAEKQASASISAANIVGDRIADTISEPLQQMTTAMEKSLEDQQMVVHDLMDKSLGVFAERLEELVGEKLTGSAEHIEAAASQMRDAMQSAPQQIEAAVTRISGVLADIAKTAEPFAEHAAKLTAAAGTLAETVEQSSETLDYALQRFRAVGAEFEKSIEASGAVAEAMSEAATSADGAARSIETAAGQFDGLSKKFESVLRELSEVANRHERDAEAHRELAAAVERAAEQLAGAQTDVDSFLEGLADALSETHATFAREINNTLSRTHEAFHQNLANATEQLAGTVHGFGEFLETDFQGSVDGLSREMTRLAGNRPPAEG